MTAKLTRLAQKVVILWHPMAESYAAGCSWSQKQVQELLDMSW
jgi:hypothetical protein